MAKRCLDCHTDVRKQFDEHGSMHGKLPEGTQCRRCHTEHRGAEAPLTRLDHFDHNWTGFKLSGKHQAVECKSCHTNEVFRGTSASCVSCHAEPDRHRGKFGTACSQCHSTDTWATSPTNLRHFNHDVAAFKLTGKHRAVDCKACHANNVFKGTAQTCVSCHAEPVVHKGHFGTACAECHTTSTWKGATFKHTFPINHGRRRTGNTCATCHTTPNNYKVYSCYGCHEHRPERIARKHRGRRFVGVNIDQCTKCHGRGRKRGGREGERERMRERGREKGRKRGRERERGMLEQRLADWVAGADAGGCCEGAVAGRSACGYKEEREAGAFCPACLEGNPGRGMKDPLPLRPEFRPPWPLRNQHVQTILGHLLRGPSFRRPTVKRLVEVAGGDRIVLHDATPAGWLPGDRMAVLVHGLGGSHDSGHPRRFAHLLYPLGVRTVRVDLRGCGDGLPLARHPPHSGRSDDLRAVLNEVHSWSPASPLWLVGVSLGANTVLKLAGEAAAEPVPGLERVAALGPPADLLRCSALMEQRRNRFYNRYFADILMANALKRRHYFPDLPRVQFPRRTTLRLFDELYTAPLNGFAGADDYYRRASSAPLIPGIRLPTLILTARDDPFIAVEPLEELRLPPHVELRVVEHGGHLGFVGSDGAGGLRWAERRVVEWLLG